MAKRKRTKVEAMGGGALKKIIAPSGRRRENFLGISCEKFYAKKSYFFNFRGGAPPPLPGSASDFDYDYDKRNISVVICDRHSETVNQYNILSPTIHK
jgi:hypothetical protein